MIFISSRSKNSAVHGETDVEVLKKQLVGDVKVKLGMTDSSKTQY